MRRRGDRDLDLGAHAIRTRGEVPTARQGVKAGERPHPFDHLFAVRRRNQRFDTLQRPLIGLDVDARRGIGEPLAAHDLLKLGELRRRVLELHLVHLELLRHRHRVGTIEAGAAELL